MIRSILAILFGYAILAVARFPDIFLWEKIRAMDALPQPVWFMASIILSAICGAVSGYFTAAIAKRSEMRHAFVLSSLFVGTGLLFVNTLSVLPLAWYHAGLLLLMVPCILLGAIFRQISAHRISDFGLRISDLREEQQLTPEFVSAETTYSNKHA